MKNFNENRFLIILLLSSFIVRLLIAPLYLEPPEFPPDFSVFASAGEAIINGTWFVNLNPTVDIRSLSSYPGPYGPLLGATYAPILFLFGRDYLLMKMLSILFDTFNVLLVYLIATNLRGKDFARYASIFYSFSYLVLFSAAAVGNNDNIELFWVLLAIFLTLKPNPNFILSAISLGIAMGYVFIPFIVLLPIVYYLYRINKVHEIFTYILTVLATFTVILLPFYLRAGLNVVYPYLGPWGIQLSNWPPTILDIDGMSVHHLIKMLSYFIIFGSDKPYNTYHFPEWASTIISLFGFTFALWYILKFRLNDKNLELVRNIFILFFVGLVFFRVFYFLNMIWMFAVLLMLFNLTKNRTANFQLSKLQIAGILLVISGTVIHASIYRWLIDYTLLERLLLIAGVIVVTIGTYLTFIDTSIKKSWTLIMFIGASINIIDARLLQLLGGIIPLFQISRYAWGIYYFAMIVLMIAAMFTLLKEVHNSTQE